MYIEEYRKAHQLGLKQVKLCQSRGGSPYLPVLDDILSAEHTSGEEDLGLVDVPMELIVGTRSAGRSKALSWGFMPLMAEDSEFAAKWTALCQAHMEEGINDPIKVYEYMRTFYVVEGHKRVSVLRHFGAVNVPACAVRVLPARDGSRASTIYYEYVDFYRLSGVNCLWFSSPGRFARLQAAVGKGPEEVWSEDDRRRFFGFYVRFSALYGDKSAKELAGRMTTGDALLLYLSMFDYREAQDFSPDQLKAGFLQLHEAFSVKKKALKPLKGLLGR